MARRAAHPAGCFLRGEGWRLKHVPVGTSQERNRRKRRNGEEKTVIYRIGLIGRGWEKQQNERKKAAKEARDTTYR